MDTSLFFPPSSAPSPPMQVYCFNGWAHCATGSASGLGHNVSLTLSTHLEVADRATNQFSRDCRPLMTNGSSIAFSLSPGAPDTLANSAIITGPPDSSSNFFGLPVSGATIWPGTSIYGYRLRSVGRTSCSAGLVVRTQLILWCPAARQTCCCVLKVWRQPRYYTTPDTRPQTCFKLHSRLPYTRTVPSLYSFKGKCMHYPWMWRRHGNTEPCVCAARQAGCSGCGLL